MPSTHRASDSATSGMTPERVRTGIIVSVIISTLSLMILGYVLLKRWINRGVRAGTVMGRMECGGEAGGRGKIDGGLEVGVVQEPLPVYMREAKDDVGRAGMEDRQEGLSATVNSGHAGPALWSSPSR
jgi:hypothetical protein